MTYKLFIDDERDPIGDDWVVVRSTTQAIFWVIEHGMPSFISFDHDLGGDDTAMAFLQWLANDCLFNGDEFDFDYYIHSQNPVGKGNIDSFIKSFKNRNR